MTCGSENDHAWQLRAVTCDAQIGTVEDREWVAGGASTCRQAPEDTIRVP